jgi:hypothetical protein
MSESASDLAHQLSLSTCLLVPFMPLAPSGQDEPRLNALRHAEYGAVLVAYYLAIPQAQCGSPQHLHTILSKKLLDSLLEFLCPPFKVFVNPGGLLRGNVDGHTISQAAMQYLQFIIFRLR